MPKIVAETTLKTGITQAQVDQEGVSFYEAI